MIALVQISGIVDRGRSAKTSDRPPTVSPAENFHFPLNWEPRKTLLLHEDRSAIRLVLDTCSKGPFVARA